MPIYEYRCTECEQIFEEWQKDFEERHAPCPVCGHRAERIISNTTFVLKGSGWYVTDYCKGGPSAPANGNGKANGKAAVPAPAGDKAAVASGEALPAPKIEAKTTSAESSE